MRRQAMVAFFTPPAREIPNIKTDRLLLTPPALSHFNAWADLREQSRQFLETFEPLWPKDDLTKAAFKRRIKRYQRNERENNGIAYLIFKRASGTLVGGITVSRILRGVAQSCAIGYWIGEPFIKQGYMSEAVSGILPEIFIEQGFHRLEAACLPHNTASIRVLEKAGFQREGYAREYLKIAGKWQDHLLFAMLESDYKRSKLDVSC